MKAEAVRRSSRIVVDTNVWIGAALSGSGVPARVVRSVLDHWRPVFSDVTFAELETRLWRPKFDRYLDIDLRRRILHDLKATADWAEIPSSLAAQVWCRDPDDDHFVRAALASGTRLMVTGDSDLLDLAPIEGLRILTPAQALRELKRA